GDNISQLRMFHSQPAAEKKPFKTNQLLSPIRSKFPNKGNSNSCSLGLEGNTAVRVFRGTRRLALRNGSRFKVGNNGIKMQQHLVDAQRVHFPAQALSRLEGGLQIMTRD